MLNELSCALLEIVILDVLEATNAVYDTELQWQMHCVLRSDALDLATAVLRSASMPHPELMCCLRCIILYYTMLYCILYISLEVFLLAALQACLTLSFAPFARPCDPHNGAVIG